MRYFKVYTNFTDFIPIDEREVEKAVYAFRTGNPVIFENGATTRIDRIVPDWNRAMGWNEGYQPTPEEHEEINEHCKNYNGFLGEVKIRVENLIREGNVALIGKEYEQLDMPKPKTKIGLCETCKIIPVEVLEANAFICRKCKESI